MGRSWLPVVVAVVLMEVIASSALASLSVVADLDSNATNGPDSLVIEPTDTVLVRLWFVGSDSILSYGVTLGDTTGALTWVPETTSTIYTSPSGWADIPVYQDSLGWLLLQATDFSGEAPIQVPYEFARLKFYVAAGDSCGTLLGDLDLSGWFNLDLGENSFTGFEGPTVCVTEVLDGGGDAPDQPGGEGGGGFDNATAECDTLPCCDYVEDKPENGRVWVVNDNGTIGTDCDCNDIQACIDSAVAEDTVCVNPGTYTQVQSLPYQRAVEPKDEYVRAKAVFTILKDSIVVKSSAGATATFVGNNTTSEPHVCILLGDTTKSGSALVDVLLEGFTAHSGSTASVGEDAAFGAGAVFCSRLVGASVVIRNNIFENNQGPHGGAMRLYGEPTITANIFRHNRLIHWAPSEPQGGAIQITGSPPFIPRPLIDSNLFIDNGYDDPPREASSGGAISFESADGVLLGNQFVSNRAGKGGAIRLSVGSSTLSIAYNVFDRCKASVSGGAIDVNPLGSHVALNVYSNTFVLNTAPASNGGGLYSSNPNLELAFGQNILAYSTGGAVVCDTLVDSLVSEFSCSDFYANVGGDVNGISGFLMSDIIYEDPEFCASDVNCSLWSIDTTSPCAPGATCDLLIGAIDTCSACNEVATGLPVSGGDQWPRNSRGLGVSPNPFNATLEISTSLGDEGEETRLSIYDVVGRLVYEFPRQSSVNRDGFETWAGRDRTGRYLPSGVYFVQERRGRAIETRKVILVR